ncbi:RpiR family transcriptional regulator [Dongia mobilis]|uniref:RpiR family transcriptional regulator n=1 Tax=Dongia mobilis TaxID=578943 RepID=A0A4R6WT31_9PROT|nr:RpiR family transcriptional regulator [Dongia mobilis]
MTLPMSRDLVLSRLQDEEAGRTQSEAMLARFFAAHLDDLPFETAASIAKRVGVSAVTVGRFLRSLGYQRLTDLTQELRGHAPSSAWQLKGSENGNGSNIQAKQLKAHVDNLTRVFAHVDRPEWRDAVKLLAEQPQVFVASFQNLRGIGHYFASQLDYARAGVRFLDGQDGTFADLFDAERRRSCLLIIDSRRYARKAGLLAERAKSAGIKVIAVTDIYCPWIETADVRLTDPGEGEVFWDSAVSTVALLELLLEAVIEHLGPKVSTRMEYLTDLQDGFGDFDDT